MASTDQPVKKGLLQLSAADSKKGIAYHKKAARHLEKAAWFYLAAAKQVGKGHYKKALKITLKAKKQYLIAGEQQLQQENLYAGNTELVM
jgi:hypothetical protein